MQASVRPPLRLFTTPTHLVVLPRQLQTTLSGSSSQLVFDCKSHQCRNARNFNPFEQDIRSSDVHMFEAYAFLGIVKVEKSWFVGIITKSAKVGSLRSHEFFQVVKVALVPVGDLEVSVEARSVLQSITEVRCRQVLESGFFYSPTFDLTRSVQLQHQSVPSKFPHSRADPKFYWNFDLYKDLSTQGAHQKWFQPLVQGFVGLRQLQLAGTECEYLLISRRSCARAGTRYNARGVDDDGEVANFVETEQVLVVNDTWFSHVMVRGTVPVFWQQTGLTAHFELMRSAELTAPAFVKSMNALIAAYGRVLFVNLLSAKKPHERVLTDALRAQVRMHQGQFEESLSYLEYDYKTETKSDFSRASALISRASPMLLCFLYFSARGGEELSRQKGVARINCLDCLDRTNIVMSRVAWFMLEWQLKSLGKDIGLPFDSPSDTADQSLAAFKSLWVENGDALSVQYTGATSTASFAAKSSGFRGFLEHSVKSLGRFYSATLSDSKKQDGIEAILGRQVSAMAKTMRARDVHRRVKSRTQEFLDEEDLAVRVVTWNVRGERPPTSEVIMNVLIDSNSAPPDILAIGLQDLVLVNAANVFQSTKNLAIVQVWTQLITVALARYSKRKYLLLRSEVQVGLASLVFVQSALASSVTGFAVDKVKLGLGTVLGGKGAIVVRFNVCHSSLCFANVHLLGDAGDVETRLQQLAAIEAQAFQVETVGKRKGCRVSSHDCVFLYGDLNFKIGSSAFDTYRSCKTADMKMLLANDQLLTVMQEKKSETLEMYQEGTLDFLPTVNRAELSKDAPDYTKPLAWTDRILFSGKGVRQLSYAPVDVRVSSHLPIVSTFLAAIHKVNEEKRQRIEREEYSKPLSLDTASSEDAGRLLLSSDADS